MHYPSVQCPKFYTVGKDDRRGVGRDVDWLFSSVPRWLAGLEQMEIENQSLNWPNQVLRGKWLLIYLCTCVINSHNGTETKIKYAQHCHKIRSGITRLKEITYKAKTCHQHAEIWCMTSHTKHGCFKVFLVTSQIDKSHHLQTYTYILTYV